jgi:hypothetical protein
MRDGDRLPLGRARYAPSADICIALVGGCAGSEVTEIRKSCSDGAYRSTRCRGNGTISGIWEGCRTYSFLPFRNTRIVEGQ